MMNPMPNMDEFFNAAEECDHPRLRSWLKKARARPSVVVDLRRLDEGLSFGPATLYLVDGDDVESEPWDPEFNLKLMEGGLRGKNPAVEGQRLALTLQHMLQPIEVRFGDGYFNLVLISFIYDSPLSRTPQVSEVLKSISNRPYDATSRADCLERIKGVITHAAQILEKKLRYSRPEASEILASAIAQYLDERFNVTNRRRLGWG